MSVSESSSEVDFLEVCLCDLEETFLLLTLLGFLACGLVKSSKSSMSESRAETPETQDTPGTPEVFSSLMRADEFLWEAWKEKSFEESMEPESWVAIRLTHCSWLSRPMDCNCLKISKASLDESNLMVKENSEEILGNWKMLEKVGLKKKMKCEKTKKIRKAGKKKIHPIK